jgi:LSD1 subclass zinc finger protein
MQCLNCRGLLEFAGGGAHARCTQCLALFAVQNGQLTPVIVQAPGGGNNPEFNNIFAQQLGFAPRMPPQQAFAPQAQFSVGGMGVRIVGPTDDQINA